jgi:hypothetical protein
MSKHAVDLDVDRNVLTGAMTGPSSIGSQHERARVGRFRDDLDDTRSHVSRDADLVAPELGVTVQKPAAAGGPDKLRSYAQHRDLLRRAHVA